MTCELINSQKPINALDHKETEQYTGSYSRANYTRYVWRHGMHKQVIG